VTPTSWAIRPFSSALVSLNEFLEDFPGVTREQAVAAPEFVKHALMDHVVEITT
jgi:hypothetical protein